jgi:hypothetical protein
MAEVTIQQTAKAVTPVTVWWRLGSAARRLVPRTREAWAALSGAAVTPAVIVGLMAWAVFSHPTLTLGSLASFVVWQLVDVGTVLFSGVSASLGGALEALGAGALVDTLATAPIMMVGAVLAYSLLCVLAFRVLYRNVLSSRSLRDRYVHGSAAS